MNAIAHPQMHGGWRSSSGRIVRITAAIAAPEIDPSPPRTTMMRMSKLFWKPSSWALSCTPTVWAKIPPATPAKNAAMTNARTLYRVVWMPIASAAISSSRMERNARP